MGSELVKGWSKSLRVRMCGFGDQNYSFSISRSYQHSEVRTCVKKILVSQTEIGIRSNSLRPRPVRAAPRRPQRAEGGG